MADQLRIEVGDLVKIKKASSYSLSNSPENNNVTGIVVDLMHDDEDDKTLGTQIDYWVRVVFLDNTKATLFHDEVEVVSVKKRIKT